MQVAVAIDAVAVNVLQDQKPPVVRSRAGIEQPRDVRMGEPREHLSLAVKRSVSFSCGTRASRNLMAHWLRSARTLRRASQTSLMSAPDEQALDRVVADAPAVVRQADCH
jgi:hypothetical protein